MIQKALTSQMQASPAVVGKAIMYKLKMAEKYSNGDFGLEMVYMPGISCPSKLEVINTGFFLFFLWKQICVVTP